MLGALYAPTMHEVHPTLKTLKACRNTMPSYKTFYSVFFAFFSALITSGPRAVPFSSATRFFFS